MQRSRTRIVCAKKEEEEEDKEAEATQREQISLSKKCNQPQAKSLPGSQYRRYCLSTCTDSPTLPSPFRGQIEFFYAKYMCVWSQRPVPHVRVTQMFLSFTTVKI